jgi:hypothetical protein
VSEDRKLQPAPIIEGFGRYCGRVELEVYEHGAFISWHRGTPAAGGEMIQGSLPVGYTDADVVGGVRLHVRSLRGLAKGECTGLSAVWCPVHGDCACPYEVDSRRVGDNRACPLHGEATTHGEDYREGLEGEDDGGANRTHG